MLDLRRDLDLDGAITLGQCRSPAAQREQYFAGEISPAGLLAGLTVHDPGQANELCIEEVGLAVEE